MCVEVAHAPSCTHITASIRLRDRLTGKLHATFKSSRVVTSASSAKRNTSQPEELGMRNRILNSSLVLLALGSFTAVGCGGGSDDEQGGELNGKGGSGGSAASSGAGGATSGAGGSIILGGTGGTTNTGGSSGTTGSGGGKGCIEDTRTGNKATVALYFMVDISGSMNCPVPEADPACEVDPGNDPMPSRWTEASQAYKDFFNSPAANGLWAGISFFSGNSCDANSYGPEVEIAALPGNAMALGNAVDAQDPGGNTPTVPSLRAAVDHARAWATAHTDQQAVVVYATDGYPRGCSQNNTIAEAATVAASGLMDGIHTYVLAIGPNLSDLGSIATAGGTTAIPINTGQDVGAQLVAALNGIRDDVVVDCAYTIPAAPPGQTINEAFVRITTGAGQSIDVGQDFPGDATCNGWEYSPDHTQIVLCGDACTTVQSDPNASFNVVFGCGTRTEPP
jgi:hypothetical protein